MADEHTYPIAPRSAGEPLSLRSPICLRCIKHMGDAELGDGSLKGPNCNVGEVAPRACAWCAKNRHECLPIPERNFPQCNSLLKHAQLVREMRVNGYDDDDDFGPAVDSLAKRSKQLIGELDVDKRFAEKRGSKVTPKKSGATAYEIAMLKAAETSAQAAMLALDVMRFQANLPPITNEPRYAEFRWADAKEFFVNRVWRRCARRFAGAATAEDMAHWGEVPAPSSSSSSEEEAAEEEEESSSDDEENDDIPP